MKNTFLFFTTILFVLLSSLTFAQTLHLIAVSDDTDADLGVKKDIEHIEKFVNKVQQMTQMELNKNYFTKSSLKDDPTRLGAEIYALDVDANDVVIFYYTGHGFNGENSEFSAFQVDGSTDGNYSTYKLDKVHSILQEKNPRLLITMYDACNWNNNNDNNALLVHLTDQELASYEKLFLKAKGDIKVASNKVGAYRYSYTSPELGGTFSNAFFTSVNTTVVKPLSEVTWDSVLSSTEAIVKKYSEEKQIPYYSANVEYSTRSHHDTPDNPKPTNEGWIKQ